jgi:hypothetical protein
MEAVPVRLSYADFPGTIPANFLEARFWVVPGLPNTREMYRILDPAEVFIPLVMKFNTSLSESTLTMPAT